MASQMEHYKQIDTDLKENPKLIKDKKWRMRNLYYIQDKRGNKVLFNPTRAQADFSNYIEKYFRLIILKARQLGFSTYIIIWILDEILFNKNKNAGIVADTVQFAGEVFNDKVQFALDNMPPSVRLAINVTKNSAKHLKVAWKDDATSQFKVALSLRGMTPHIVHSTEIAKQVIVAPQKANEFITGTLPAIPMDGKLFIESTANGMAGYFYDTFMKGWKKKDKINKEMSRATPYPVFYNWQWDDMDMQMIEEPIKTEDMDETPDINWKEYQQEHGLTDIEITYYYLKWKSLGEDVHKLQQEYPTTPEEAFGSSGMTYLSQAKLFKCKQELIEPKRYHVSNEIELVPDASGDLYLYRDIDKSKSYVIGGDVAEGLAHGDWSVLAIVEATTKDLVGIYYCKEDPYEFSQIAYRVGTLFNNALMVIESNKDGLYVNDMLVQANYPNMYYREEVDAVTKQVNSKMGWKTSSTTRPYALSAMKTVFNRGSFWGQGLFIDEALTFVVNERGRAEAMSGKHDDCFVAGTKVLTPNGQVNIEDLKIGDDVITRDGPKSILNTSSSIKPVISKLGLVGTPTHPMITTTDESKHLCMVEDSDTLYIWNESSQKIEKQSYTRVKNITDTQTHQEANTPHIFGDMINGNNRLLHYIGKFGLTIMEKFQKALLFTIKMETHLTMKSQTFSASLQATMQNTTCLAQGEEKLQVRQRRSKDSGYLSLGWFGGGLKKVRSFSGRTLRGLSISVNRERMRALSAKLHSLLFRGIASIARRLVVILSAILGLGQRRRVYNLFIEDKHEYFANNILVHNCIMATSIAYGAMENKHFEDSKPSTTGDNSLMAWAFGEITIDGLTSDMKKSLGFFDNE